MDFPYFFFEILGGTESEKRKRPPHSYPLVFPPYRAKRISGPSQDKDDRGAEGYRVWGYKLPKDLQGSFRKG